MGTYHIDLETSSGLNLAYQGENKAHKVIVHYGKWAEEYGEGTLGIMIQRPGDEAPYLAGAVVVGANHTVEWTILAQDLAFRGYGKVQFRYTVDDVIVKSKLFDFKVERSLDDLVNPPSVWQSYIDIVASDRARAEAAAGKAEEATVHAPIPGSNGNWFIWDQDAEDYLDSGEPAVITPIFLDELPETGQFGFLYMIPSSDPGEDNLWDEYLWTGTAFERIGSATIDLSNYVQKLASSTTGDVLTASADGGIADSGTALSDLVTDSELTTALAQKVGFTDYPTAIKAGVVCIGGTTYGLKMYGDTLETSQATNAQIDAKANQFCPITPNNLNYAVRKALESNSSINTDAIKDSVCGTIGAVRTNTYTADKAEIEAEIAEKVDKTSYEEWTFTLDDNTTVTKKVVVV